MRFLPEWDVCEGRVACGNATKLEAFIYNNEPAGEKDAADFRKSLGEVITEAITFAADRFTPCDGGR